jgi:hypothetical protein
VTRWDVAAASAVGFLTVIRPYIHSREERERIDLALKIQAVKVDWPVPMEERDQYRDTLHQLVADLREINDARG